MTSLAKKALGTLIGSKWVDQALPYSQLSNLVLITIRTLGLRQVSLGCEITPKRCTVNQDPGSPQEKMKSTHNIIINITFLIFSHLFLFLVDAGPRRALYNLYTISCQLYI